MGSRCEYNSDDGNSGSGNHNPFHRNYHLFFVNRDFIPRSKYYKDFSHCDLPKTSCRCSSNSNSYQDPPRPPAPERYPESERDDGFRKPGGCCQGRYNGNSPYPRLPSWMAPGQCSSTRQTYSFNPTTFSLRGYESFNPFSPSYGTPCPYFGKSNSNNYDTYSNNPSPVHNVRPGKESPSSPNNQNTSSNPSGNPADSRHKQGSGPGPGRPVGSTSPGGKKITSNFDAWATPIDTPNASTTSILIGKANSRYNLNSNKKNQKQPNANARNVTSHGVNPERLVTAFDAWATPSQISITSTRSSTLNSKTNLNSSQKQKQPNPGPDPDPKFQTLTSPGNSSQTRDRGGTDAKTTTTPRKEDANQETTMTIAPMITTRAIDYKNADYSSPTKSAYTSAPQRDTNTNTANTQVSPENAAIFSGPRKGNNSNLPPEALELQHTEGAETKSAFNEGQGRAEHSADGAVAPFSKTLPPTSNVPLPPSVVPKKAILKTRTIPEADTERESTTSQTQTTNNISAGSSSSIVDSVTKKVRISDRKTVDGESNTVSTPLPLLSTATPTATATSESPSKPKTKTSNNQTESPSDGNTSRNSADGKGKASASNTADGKSQGKSGNVSDKGSGKGGENSSLDGIETIIPPEPEAKSKVPDPATTTTTATASTHSRGASSASVPVPVPAKSLHDAFGTRISDVPAITKLQQKWVQETKKDKATTPAPTPQASTSVSNSDQENSYTVNVVELPGLSKAEFFQNASRNQGSGGEGKQKENYNNGGAMSMDDSGGLSSAVSINNETSTPSNESTQLAPTPVPGEGKYQYGQPEYPVTSPTNFLSDVIPEPMSTGELKSFNLNQNSLKPKEIKIIPKPTAMEAPTRANKLKQQLDEINASLISPRLNSGGNGIADVDAEAHQHQHQQQQHLYNKSDQIPPNEATGKTRAEIKPRFLPGTKNSRLSLSSQIFGTKQNVEHQSVDQEEFPKASSSRQVRQVTTPLQETPVAVATTATTTTAAETEPWEWLVGGVSSPKKASRTSIKPPGPAQLSTSNASPAKNGILAPEILENALTLMKNSPPNQTRNRLANPDSDSKDGSDTRIENSDDVVEITDHPANKAPLKNGGQEEEHFTAKIPNRNSSTNNLSKHERVRIQSGQNSPTPKNSKLKSNKTEINPRMSNGSRLIGNEASFNPHKGQKTEAEFFLLGSSNSERAGHDNTGAVPVPVPVPVNASSIEDAVAEVGTTTPPEELAIHRFDKWGTPLSDSSINLALRERNPAQFDILNRPVSHVVSPTNLNTPENVNVNGTRDPLNESRQEYQPWHEKDSSIITRSPAGNSKISPNQQELKKVSSRQNSSLPGEAAVHANSSTAAFAQRLESPQLLVNVGDPTRSPVGYSRNGSNKQLINQNASKPIKPVEDVNPPGASKLNGVGSFSSNDTEIEANSKSPGRYFDLSKVPKQLYNPPSGQVSISARPPEAEAETDTTATTAIITSLKSQSSVENWKNDPNQELTDVTVNSSNLPETATAVNPTRLPNPSGSGSGSNKLSLGDRSIEARSSMGSANNIWYPHPQMVQQAQESSRAIAIQTSETEPRSGNLNSPKFSNAAVQVYPKKMTPPQELKEFKTKSPFQNFNKALIQSQDIIENDEVNSPHNERKPNTGKMTPKMLTTPPTPMSTTPPQAESTSTQTTVTMSPKPLPMKRLNWNRETEVDLSNMSIQNENGHDFISNISKKSEPTSTEFFPPSEVERTPRIAKQHGDGRQGVPKIKTSSAIKSSAQPQPQPLEELEKINLNKIKNTHQKQMQDDYPNQNEPFPGELSPVIESLFFNPINGPNRSDGNGKNTGTGNIGSQRSSGSGRQSPTMHIPYHTRASKSSTGSNAATQHLISKAPPKKKDLSTAHAEYEIDDRKLLNPDFNKRPEKSIKRSQDPRSQLILQSEPEPGPEPTPNKVQKRSLDEAIQTRDNRNKKTNAAIKGRDSANTEALNSNTTSKIVPTTKTKGPTSGDCNDDEGSWLSRDAVSGMRSTLLNPWYWAAVVGGLVVAGLLYQNCGCGCPSHSSHSTSSSLHSENVNSHSPTAACKGACQGQTHANSLVRVPLNHTNTTQCKFK